MSECTHPLRQKRRFYHHGPEAARVAVESILLCDECAQAALDNRIPLWEQAPAKAEVAAMRERLAELDPDEGAPAPWPEPAATATTKSPEADEAPGVAVSATRSRTATSPPTEGKGRPGRNTPDRTCEVPGCGRAHHSKGRCSRCHYRARAGGWLEAHPEGDPERWAARRRHRRQAHPGQGGETHGRTCDVPGCEEPHKARGRCPLHYQRARMHGWVEEDPAQDEERWAAHRDGLLVEAPACEVPGCETSIEAMGRCKKHYSRARRYGWLDEDPAQDEERWAERPPQQMQEPHSGLCAVPGCDQPFYSKGRCKRHYSRARRHGWRGLDPAGDEERAAQLAAERVRATAARCEVPGCDREHKARGRCSLHHSRAITLQRLDEEPAGDDAAWEQRQVDRALAALREVRGDTDTDTDTAEAPPAEGPTSAPPWQPARMLWAVTEPAVAPFDADSLVAIVEATTADEALAAARADLGAELDGAEAHLATCHDLAVRLESERELAALEVDDLRGELRRARLQLVAAELLLVMPTLRFPAEAVAEVVATTKLLHAMKRSGRLPEVLARPADDLITERGAAK